MLLWGVDLHMLTSCVKTQRYSSARSTSNSCISENSQPHGNRSDSELLNLLFTSCSSPHRRLMIKSWIGSTNFKMIFSMATITLSPGKEKVRSVVGIQPIGQSWQLYQRISGVVTDLAPCPHADCLAPLRAATAWAQPAGFCHSFAEAGRYWCWLCSGCPAEETVMPPECYWSLYQVDFSSCPHTAEWLWPIYQPL